MFACMPEHATAGVNAWTTTGPRTAWSLLAADPRAGGVLFVGARGRFYRSTDRGVTWSPVSVSGLGAAEPEAFWFDPNTAHRVYAAFGTFNIYRSDDDGARWTPLPGAFGSPQLPASTTPGVVRLEGSSSGANRIYVLADRVVPSGLTYSADDGLTWSSISPRSLAFILDFALDQTAPNTIYATGSGGVFRTLDNGTTWQPLNTGLPAGIAGFALVVDPAKSGRVLMLGSLGNADPWTRALYVSNDQGATWSQTATLFANSGGRAQIVFDSSNPATIYVRSGSETMRSADNGATWQALPLLHDAAWLGLAAVDSGRVYGTAANYGLLRSDDQGKTWLAQNHGLPGGETKKLGVVASVPFVLFGLVNVPRQSATAFRRGSSANLWLAALSDRPFRGLGAFGASARNSGRVLAATNAGNGLPRFLSSDSGVTWGAMDRSGVSGVIDSVVFSPASDATVFAVGELVLIGTGYSAIFGAVARSFDGGVNWQDLHQLLPLTPSISAFTIDPTQPANIYAGTTATVGIVIARSADGGDHWTALPLPTIQGDRVASILVNPNDSRHLIAAFGAHHEIYQSRDSGQTWNSLSDNLTGVNRVDALAADWSSVPALLFAGTDQGVFMSPIAPVTWSRIAGSQNLAVNDLRLNRPPGSNDRMTVTAATDSGVWEYTFDQAGVLQPVFRFYNTQTGAHFYTGSTNERDHVIQTWPQFVYEGTAFIAATVAAPGTLPIYRFYNTQNGAHFYTASAAERDQVIANLPQFSFEGVRYYAFTNAEPGSVKLYRSYNTQTGAHFYTTQDDERDAVNQHLPQFVDEGVVYNVYPAASQE